MFFWQAKQFFNYLTMIRFAWIRGHPGGGKTSLAVGIAGWLYQHRYIDTICANIPIRGSQNPPIPMWRAALILDESWMFLRKAQAVADYAAFTRKFDIFLPLPSTLAPHLQLRAFTVWRKYNLYLIGLPVWIYNWRWADGTDILRGSFWWVNPKPIWKTYVSRGRGSIPRDDGGIAYAIAESIRREELYTTKRGARTGSVADARKHVVKPTDRDIATLRQIEVDGSDFTEAADSISLSAEILNKASRRRR